MSHLNSLREAVAQSPQNVPLLLLLARACMDEFLFEEARGTFETALKCEPGNPQAAMGIVRVLYHLGNFSEASVRAEALLMAKPDHAEAAVLLSRIQLAEGHASDARATYEKARSMVGFTTDPALEKDLFGSAESKRPEAPARVPVSANDGPMDDFSGFGGEDRSEELLKQFVEKADKGFESVGGMEAVKEEIRMKILYPIQNKDLFKAYGKKIGGGVLMYGPPGCGKTMLSKATAGEINANFMSIGLHQILDLYLGNSEKNLHQIFELARDHSPTVLFFDEVDALAADRTDLRKSAGRTLINQFLSEMDDGSSANEGLLILGATNAPWHIDPAFRRPGRFDRVLFVPPPDQEARESIISILSKGKPVDRIDARALAKATKDFSGADLKSVFDVATEACLSEAMKSGRMVPITTDRLIKAAKQTRPSTKAWFDSAKNYALFSNQGGFYNDVLTFLGITK